jgi:hypothetical protein
MLTDASSAISKSILQNDLPSSNAEQTTKNFLGCMISGKQTADQTMLGACLVHMTLDHCQPQQDDEKCGIEYSATTQCLNES